MAYPTDTSALFATTVGLHEAPELPHFFWAYTPDTSDTDPPVVSNVSPVAASNISASTPLLQRITDAQALSGVTISVRYAGVWETAYVGALVEGVWSGSFGPNYATSTITPATDGYDFALSRTGGWGAEGTAFDVLPFATDGNTNE